MIGDYHNTHTKILIKHNFCGNVFNMSPHAFLQGQRCPKEVVQRRASRSIGTLIIPYDEVVKRMLKSNPDYKLVGDFTFVSKKALIEHLKCGRNFKATPDQIISRRSGCPYCYSSKGEDAVRDFLNVNNFDFKEQYRIKDCRNKRALPFDFAIFENNKLLLLIEYDGIQHTKPKFGQREFMLTKFRDNIKNKYCRENGIDLVRIPYKRTNNYGDLKEYIFEYLYVTLIR